MSKNLSDSEDLLSDVSDEDDAVTKPPPKPAAPAKSAVPAKQAAGGKPAISTAALDDMSEELSFSLAGSTPSKFSPPKPISGKAPARPSMKGYNNDPPKAAPPSPNPSAEKTNKEEKSKPVEEQPQTVRLDVTVSQGCDTTHIVGVERTEREHLQKIAATEWAHLQRQCSTGQIDALRKEKERQRKELRRDGGGARETDPAMQQYIKALKEPRSRAEIEQLTNERQATAKRLKQSTDRTGELEEEMKARKEYTEQVTREVHRQERDRVEAMHRQKEEAKKQERATVAQLAQQRKEEMAASERNRLSALKQRHAYVAVHGDYESRVVEGDTKRFTRQLTTHDDEKEAKMNELRKSIAQKAQQRREAAAEKAAQSEQLAAERRALAERRRSEVRELSSRLESEDAVKHRDALLKLRQEESAFEKEKTEENREKFLTRMTGNAELMVDVERARQQRAADERELWQSKQAAKREAQELARITKVQAAKNHALGTRIESLMIDEARVVQEAKDRLSRRLFVERRQQERIAQLHHSDCHQRKVLEAMYSRERAASCPPTDAPSPSNKNRSDKESVQSCDATSIKARDVVAREEAERKRLFLSPPRHTKILSPIAATPSFAFPTRSMLQNPPSSVNPRILELAQKILELEQQGSGPAMNSSAADRAAARERLTQRSAAQEASRYVHVTAGGDATIHSGIPPQHGVSRRLYNADDYRQSPQRAEENAADGKEPNVDAFVKRFYEEPLQRRERSAAQTYSKVVGAHEEPAVTYPEKEIGTIVERLHSTATRHVHTKSNTRNPKRVKTITNDAAVERFYSTPLQRQREEIAALDKIYL